MTCTQGPSDSDSVNLGSNPSPPAIDIIKQSMEIHSQKSRKKRNESRMADARKSAQLPTIDTVALPRLRADDTGYVYVIGNETGEFVKIGWSTQIMQRLATLQSYIPTMLKVYALNAYRLEAEVVSTTLDGRATSA